ncbi:DUF927 domain-containing protein [Novosphingobium sp. PASSN1]|uniref:DUF927 domain-containing protein n=1 Tax=Novosphingobium sp. PASSN1 TaxID=2015561 RepID=UPI000BD19200|nr:DUF927 domain-containing protein [Novosphingobium sp. PASSN1]OYU34659.1 MAG: hypothetical protein CFE35_14890 [Novosphingobium sp. PASSN1]
MTNLFSATGFVAASGQRYVRVEGENAVATLRREQFSLANPRLAADLAAAGLPLFTKKQHEDLISEVRFVDHFEENRIAEHPGWNGKQFVQHNGNVIGSEAPPLLVFRPIPGIVRARGTLASWQERVVAPLVDQPLPAIAVMAAFLPPLLPIMPQAGNVAVEIVGPSNTGKSVVQLLAASVMGPAAYIQSMRNVQLDPEAARRNGRDHLTIIDHTVPAILTSTKTKKIDLFATVAFDLVRAPGGRVILLSGREPLAEACDMTPEDSILTLRVSNDGLGVFDTLPEPFPNSAAFAASLASAAKAHHGHAYREFLVKLQAARSEKPGKLSASLTRAQTKFLGYANVSATSTHFRAATTFAAIYAAGCLARRYRVLPPKFPCKQLALDAFDRYRSAQAAQVPFLARLEHLIASGQLLVVTDETDPSAQAHAAKEASGTLTLKPTVRIIKIAPDKIAVVFPNWNRLKYSPEVRALLKVDGKNLAVWGKLAPGTERIRLFQFELPPEVEPTLFTGTEVGGPEDSRS